MCLFRLELKQGVNEYVCMCMCCISCCQSHTDNLLVFFAIDGKMTFANMMT